MARLTEEQIAQGRALVQGGDVAKLMAWVREHAPVGLSYEMYERTVKLCFLAGDMEKALKLHNAVFDTYDADVERAAIVVKKLGVGLVALALIGGIGAAVLGIIWLVRAVF